MGIAMDTLTISWLMSTISRLKMDRDKLNQKILACSKAASTAGMPLSPDNAPSYSPEYFSWLFPHQKQATEMAKMQSGYVVNTLYADRAQNGVFAAPYVNMVDKNYLATFKEYYNQYMQPIKEMLNIEETEIKLALDKNKAQTEMYEKYLAQVEQQRKDAISKTYA